MANRDFNLLATRYSLFATHYSPLAFMFRPIFVMPPAVGPVFHPIKRGTDKEKTKGCGTP
jgi:hypothetical protein